MTGFGYLIPADLLDVRKKDEFLMWLARLEVDIWTKKYMLLYWSQLTGAVITEDMVQIITGGNAHKTRDKG